MAGAVAGGMIVGPFSLQPAWLTGMLGGAAGGLIGALAGSLFSARFRWHWAVRALAAALVLGAGFGLLWLAAARQWVLEAAARAVAR